MSEFDFEPLSRPASTLRYVVCGASGRVGRSVAERLLSQGHSVRAVTRDAGRVSDLAERGADIRVGSPQDAEFLAGVMDGADAAFVLTPVDVLQPDVNAEQARVVRGTLEAIRRSGLRHVVLLSSWGAELAEPVGGVIATHWFEQGLD
ncbi:MAG TPA: NAD(P)H-binding protein, partial [Kribbella sp.]|nr:NAD(P)H-binding protein [Kribbella sp.]